MLFPSAFHVTVSPLWVNFSVPPTFSSAVSSVRSSISAKALPFSRRTLSMTVSASPAAFVTA